MEIIDIEKLWQAAIEDLLDSKLDANTLRVLAQQTYDSIRRIGIYKSYKERANKAVHAKQSFIHTSIPFVLAQRADLGQINSLWVLYVATYFGKSRKSKWELFQRATFDKSRSIMSFEDIRKDVSKYFMYLSSFDFFEGCTYSNHRKFTAKKLAGAKGVFESMEYFVKNIDSFSMHKQTEFDIIYRIAQKIPNYGRLAAFDFTSSLVKCGFNIEEPQSMYGQHSTGPIVAIGLILKLTNNSSSSTDKLKLCSSLMEWFQQNTDIFMVGQVLEDAICNWQKDTTQYILYQG